MLLALLLALAGARIAHPAAFAGGWPEWHGVGPGDLLLDRRGLDHPPFLRAAPPSRHVVHLSFIQTVL